MPREKVREATAARHTVKRVIKNLPAKTGNQPADNETQDKSRIKADRTAHDLRYLPPRSIQLKQTARHALSLLPPARLEPICARAPRVTLSDHSMQHGPDSWQICLFAVAALIVALKAWHGWRLGVARQAIGLMALACAYFCAIFGGRVLAPVLFILGVPSRLSGIAGGALLGLLVYVTLSIAGAILFKKTSQQSLGVVRFGYGFAGAVIGGFMGLVVVWIGILGIRLLGTVAKTQIEASHQPPSNNRGRLSSKPAPSAPGSIVRGLARIKESLEQGATGAVVEHVDPIPGTLYSLLTKVGQMISNEQSIDRFLAYPGVKTLTEHPKIAALHSDPEIAKNLVAQDYFALVRNQHIIRAANDREIGELMTKFDFEKALDYALHKTEKHDSAGLPR